MATSQTIPYDPTTIKIMNLISSLRSNIAASGATPVTDVASNPGQLAVLQRTAAAPDTNALATAQQQMSQGKTLNQLPPSVRALVLSTTGIKNSTPPTHRGILGSVLHSVENTGGSLLGRASDVLSRGQYISANLAKSAENDAGNVINHPNVKNILHAVEDLNPAGGLIISHPGTALKGLTGKEKGNYSDVIQHGADLVKERGNVQAANANPGIQHVNKWVKGIGGLVGDVALDPTTYLGTGLVGKVLESPKLVEAAAKAGKVGEDAERIGTKVVDDSGVKHTIGSVGMQQALGAKTGLYAPGKTIARKDFLLPQQVKAAIENGKPAVIAHAHSMAEDAWKTAETQATKTITADRELTPMSDSVFNHEVTKETKRLLDGKTVPQMAADNESQLLEILHQNITPKIARGLGIKFAGQSVATIPVEKLVQRAYEFRAGDSALSAPVRKLEKMFHNSAFVNPELNAYRLNQVGKGGQKVVAHMHQIREAYRDVSKEDLKRTIDAYRGDLSHVVISGGKDATGLPIEDLTKHFAVSINKVQSSIMPHVGELDSINELNHSLPYKYHLKLHGLEGKAVTKNKDNEYVNLDPEWLKKNIIEWSKSKDPDLNNPAHIQFALESALERATTHRGVLQGIAENFGHTTRLPFKVAGNARGLPDQFTRKLVDNYGYRKVYKPLTKYEEKNDTKVIPYLKGHVFDPETATGIERLYSAMTDGGSQIDDVLKGFDMAQRSWKSLVTKFNPGYHERNLFGEVFNSYLAGVKNPKVYEQAASVLHGRSREFLGDAAEFSGKANRADISAHNVLQHNAFNLAKDVGSKPIVRVIKMRNGRVIRQSISRDQFWHGFVDNGLKTGFISTEFDKGVDTGTNTISKLLHGANTKAQKLTENIEDYARMAHFIDAVQKSKIRDVKGAMEEAAREVRHFHFDYTDFTKFERQWMSRVFPFYKWTRKNIPLMLEQTFAHPGRVIAPIKAERALSQSIGGYNSNNHILPVGDSVVPDWLKKDMAVPLFMGKNGDTNYLDPPLPWQQALEAVQSPISTTGQMASQAFQIPAQIYTGKTLGGQTASGSKIFANSTPFTALLHNLVTGKAQGKSNTTTLLQFLTGLGIQENTQARMEAEAKRQQQTASAARVKAEKARGTFVSSTRTN